MVNSVNASLTASIRIDAAYAKQSTSGASNSVSNTASSSPKDILSLGKSSAIGQDDAMNMVLERAYEKLKGLVADAREALGIPEGAEIDTSPEATAQRITDFALGFFSQYAENNGLANDEEGRSQFADFIGAAITQGIDEARGILDALQVLDGNIAADIDTTASLIQDRLADFITNGLSD